MEPAIMEFTMTARGAPALVLNGFKYLVNQKNASANVLLMWQQKMVYYWEKMLYTHTPLAAQADRVVSTMDKRAQGVWR